MPHDPARIAETKSWFAKAASDLRAGDHELTAAAFGQLLETFVFQELRRQADWQDNPIHFFHFRDKDGAEVDLVIERGVQTLAGIEVKAGATVTASDFQGLRKLRAAAGLRFTAGVVLYDGESVVSFGDQFFAVPVRALWE